MVDQEIVIRDFIYLDWERLRSIAAQVFEGLPEDKTYEKSDEKLVKSEIGANFLAIKSKIGGDIRYFNSERETRSLHHYVYYLTEKKLLESGCLKNFSSDFNFDLWTEDLFYDGQFVTIQGLIRIIDLNWMYMWMDNFQQSLKTIQMYELKGISDKQSQAAKRKEQEKSMEEIKNLKLDEMKKLMKQLYGETNRIKVVPSISHPMNIFVGSGDPKYFNETGKSLSEKYGYDIEANWTVFGQINFSKKGREKQAVAFPTGNKMEDAIENIIIGLNEVQKVASHIAFPAIAFTPISIYRTNLNK